MDVEGPFAGIVDGWWSRDLLELGEPEALEVVAVAGKGHGSAITASGHGHVSVAITGANLGSNNDCRDVDLNEHDKDLVEELLE